MLKLSKQFLIQLKFNRLPAYRIAQNAGVNPNTLSRLVNGIDPVRPRDKRIIAVGEIIGLSASACFSDSEIFQQEDYNNEW